MGSKQVFNPLSGSFDITYTPDGGEMFSGAGTPSESLGPTGAYYFDNANTKMHGPKLEVASPTVVSTRDFSVADAEDIFDGDASIVAGQLLFNATTYASWDIEVGYMGLVASSTYNVRLYITSFSGDVATIDVYSQSPDFSATNAEMLAAVGSYVDIQFQTGPLITNTMGIYLDGGTGSTLEISHIEFISPALKWGNGYDLHPNERVNTLSGNETNKMPSVSAVNVGLAQKASLASPDLSGTPTAPTAILGNDTNQIATTAFVIANAGGGGGANTELSNLVAPTAINQDLVGDKASIFKIKSKDQTGANSEFVSLESGTGDSSGNIYINTADGSNGTSGDINIGTGISSSGNLSGSVIITTGGNGTDDTGGITLSCAVSAGFRGGINMEAAEVQVNGMNIKGVADPVDLDDAATKNYVDNAVSGGLFDEAVANTTFIKSGDGSIMAKWSGEPKVKLGLVALAGLANNGLAFSSNGKFCACGHATTPFISIVTIDKGANSFSKTITNVGAAATEAPNQLYWTKDGKFLIALFANAPFMRVYKVDELNETFDYVGAAPTITGPVGAGSFVFSKNEDLIVIGFTSAGGAFKTLVILDFNMFTGSITNPRNMPGTTTTKQILCMAFTNDGLGLYIGIAFATGSNYYFLTFDPLTNNFTYSFTDQLSATTIQRIEFSPNGEYMALTVPDATSGAIVYKNTVAGGGFGGGNFTGPLTFSGTVSTGTKSSIAWSLDSDFFVVPVGGVAAPQTLLYRVTPTTVFCAGEMLPLVDTTDSRQVAISPDGKYICVTQATLNRFQFFRAAKAPAIVTATT
jgi:hypothetical protein